MMKTKVQNLIKTATFRKNIIYYFFQKPRNPHELNVFPLSSGACFPHENTQERHPRRCVRRPRSGRWPLRQRAAGARQPSSCPPGFITVAFAKSMENCSSRKAKSHLLKSGPESHIAESTSVTLRASLQDDHEGKASGPSALEKGQMPTVLRRLGIRTRRRQPRFPSVTPWGLGHFAGLWSDQNIS